MLDKHVTKIKFCTSIFTDFFFFACHCDIFIEKSMFILTEKLYLIIEGYGN